MLKKIGNVSKYLNHDIRIIDNSDTIQNIRGIFRSDILFHLMYILGDLALEVA